jgi:hypothetical protein
MFPWNWITTGDDSSYGSVEEGWFLGPSSPATLELTDEEQLLFWAHNDDNLTPGTLEYFTQRKSDLEARLIYPDTKLPALWTETLQASQAAQDSLGKVQKVLEDLQKEKAKDELIQQAQQAVDQATAAVSACADTVRMVGDSLLSSDERLRLGQDDGDTESPPSIPIFLSASFDDSDWVTLQVLQDPQYWAGWCCPTGEESPDPERVATALRFLHNVDDQRRILSQGGGPPRLNKWGGYFDILQELDSSSSAKETVLERLAQAVALEFAAGDYCYFDTTETIDPVERYLHYEQAYLMGDLDPSFSTFSIWELRLAVNSNARSWELQWGRECLQTYRPDWALTEDPQWRYCRLVRLDVGYMTPSWTSSPRTYDQILSGGGKCGPRAWFGRFMCQAFGIPIWGVRQPGHAAMTRWTEQGWMTCLGAGFAYSWWQDQTGYRCGLDFQLETQVRDKVATPIEYMQQVVRLEWLAAHEKESNDSILKRCQWDAAAPWYALSLVQRQKLTAAPTATPRLGHPRSTRVVPKILHVRTTAAPKSVATIGTEGICIPADTTTTPAGPSVLNMPSFTGGRQVFLGKDAVLDYDLAPHWLPLQPQTFRLSVQVASAHARETTLLVTVHSQDDSQVRTTTTLRLPLPYTKGLWQETETVAVTLCRNCTQLSLAREWQELYGVSLKAIHLVPC